LKIFKNKKLIADNYNQGGNYGSYDGYRQGGRNGRGICRFPKQNQNRFSMKQIFSNQKVPEFYDFVALNPPSPSPNDFYQFLACSTSKFDQSQAKVECAPKVTKVPKENSNRPNFRR
jgi:hypothetical protein